MTFSLPWSTRHTALTAGGLSLALMAPLVNIQPAIASSFSDVSFSYWARPFIESLAQYNIINGYSDGTFRPDEPISRSQFESMLQRSFGSLPGQRFSGFVDDQPISRMQALVTLSNRLNLEPEGSINSTLSTYRDAVEIPSYAREGIAAATQHNLVVNYPNVRSLNPYQTMTRADASAFVYQALVQQGQLSSIRSDTRTANYIVDRSIMANRSTPTEPVLTSNNSAEVSEASDMSLLAQGTQIPLEYPGSRDINFVIAPGETYETTLAVANPILNQDGDVVIPEGSKVQGRFVPMRVNGKTPATQFIADRLVLDEKSYALSATSDLRMAVSESELRPADLRESVSSAAAQSIVQSIMGKPTGLGSFLSNTFGLNESEASDQSVIMIKPESLTLTTQSNLMIASQ